jgi:hypothetical protein
MKDYIIPVIVSIPFLPVTIPYIVFLHIFKKDEGLWKN